MAANLPQLPSPPATGDIWGQAVNAYLRTLAGYVNTLPTSTDVATGLVEDPDDPGHFIPSTPTGTGGGTGGGGTTPPPTVPGTPAAPAVVAGNAQATLTWVAPTDGGSAITGYDVQNVTTGVITSVGTTATATLTGLTNGTSYTFKVRARNSVGVGPLSIASAAVIPTAPVVVTNPPGTPAITVTASSGQNVIGWTAPPMGTSAITGYTLQRQTYAANGTTVTTPWATVATPAAATRSYVNTGLTNGLVYGYRLSAASAAGTSAYSTEVKGSPTAPVTPGTTIRYLGIYSGGPSTDDDVKTNFGSYPDMSSTYYQINQTNLSPAETTRVRNGIVPLITITCKGTQYIAGIANGTDATALAWLADYVDSLDTLSRVNTAVPLYATVEHEWDVKTGTAAEITGDSALPANYAKYLSKFIALCRANAPLVKVGMWTGGASTRTSAIAQVLAGLTGQLDWYSADPYNWYRDSTPTKTFEATCQSRIDWIKANADYVRLGSPDIGISEMGMDAKYPSANVAAFYTDLRTHLKNLGLKFAVLYNRDRPQEPAYWKIDSGATYPEPTAVSTFGDSLDQVVTG